MVFWTVYVLGQIFMPVVMAIGGWIIMAAWIGTCKAIIEGLFEIQDGSATILILYVCFVLLIKVYILPIITGGPLGLGSDDDEPAAAVLVSSARSGAYTGGGPGQRPQPQGLVRRFDKHDDTVYDLVFLPGDTHLATASADNQVRIYDANTGDVLRTLSGHAGAVRCLALSADGQFLASAGDDSVIRLWSVATGQQVGVLQGHQGAVHDIAFHPEGGFLVSGGADAKLRYFELSSGRALVWEGCRGAIRAVGFTSDGSLVMVAGDDYTVRIVDFFSRQEVWSYTGGMGMITAATLAPDRRHVLAGDTRGALFWIDMAGNRIAAQIEGHRESKVTAVMIDPGTREIYSAGEDGMARRWASLANQGAFTSLTQIRHGGGGYGSPTIYSLAMSSDGRFLLTGSYDDTACLWEVVKLNP